MKRGGCEMETNNREQIIRSRVEAYCRAVETQDEAAFRALWGGDSPTLISIGTVYAGIDSICRDFLIGGIRRAYASIRLVAEDLSIRFDADNLAVVVFGYHTECIRRDTGAPHGIRGMETQLFVLEDGDWKLTHLHYSKA